MHSPQNELVAALDRLAESLLANPSSAIGMKVSVSGDGKGGNVTGLRVTAIGGKGAGNVTGLQVSVEAGVPNTALLALANELRQAAATVRAGVECSSWVSSLVARAKELGNRALDGSIEAVASAATAYFLGR
jgi:hypothetical protein